jgi:hypothetical protein
MRGTPGRATTVNISNKADQEDFADFRDCTIAAAWNGRGGADARGAGATTMETYSFGDYVLGC